jgi:hypothetical protein
VVSLCRRISAVTTAYRLRSWPLLRRVCQDHAFHVLLRSSGTAFDVVGSFDISVGAETSASGRQGLLLVGPRAASKLTAVVDSDGRFDGRSYGVLEAGSWSGNSKREKIMGVRKAVTSATRSSRKVRTSSAIGR